MRTNLTGQVFNNYVVEAFAGISKSGYAKWFCRCSVCNNQSDVFESTLYKKRNTTSNSCVHCKYLQGGSIATHGNTCNKQCSPEYKSWRSMKQRCYCPNNPSYKKYGGRGITVCQEWVDSFENFLEDMGNKPSATYTIDRIDVDDDYYPENCRWASKKEQVRNRTNTVCLTYQGVTKPLAHWAEQLNISEKCLRSRIVLGWSDEKILTTPARPKLGNKSGNMLR